MNTLSSSLIEEHSVSKEIILQQGFDIAVGSVTRANGVLVPYAYTVGLNRSHIPEVLTALEDWPYHNPETIIRATVTELRRLKARDFRWDPSYAIGKIGLSLNLLTDEKKLANVVPAAYQDGKIGRVYRLSNLRRVDFELSKLL